MQVTPNVFTNNRVSSMMDTGKSSAEILAIARFISSFLLLPLVIHFNLTARKRLVSTASRARNLLGPTVSSPLWNIGRSSSRVIYHNIPYSMSWYFTALRHFLKPLHAFPKSSSTTITRRRPFRKACNLTERCGSFSTNILGICNASNPFLELLRCCSPRN